MRHKLRAYHTSIQFFRLCQSIKCSAHLRDQLFRAASSISLNLSEGCAQPTPANRGRFYHMALGSVRECQTIFDLANVPAENEMAKVLDVLAAHVYRLCKPRKDPKPEEINSQPRNLI